MFSRLIKSCTNMRSLIAFSNHIENKRLPAAFNSGLAHQKLFCSTQTNFVDDREKMLKILMLEASVMRQEGRKVPDPDLIKPQQWEHLLSLKSRSARTKYYVFLWQIEKKTESNSVKKEKRAIEIAERKEQLDLENVGQDKYLIYSLMHNSYFLRIYDTAMNHWHNNKLISAMQFGQKLVYDCSYDEHMTSREAINAAKQLMLCFAENRMHDEPFDMYYCNAKMDGTTMQQLQRNIPTMCEPWFPLNVHTESYLDIFPKEKLVYLTPHCKNDLMEYNPDDVYIIGAMVDKINNEPLSLAKAKRLGLRMARLPLDHYLQWGSGSGKSLTLNHMLNIMLDIKSTGSWEQALQHVPRRKIIRGNVDENVDRERERWQKKNESRMGELKFDLNNWGNSGNKKREMSFSEQMRNESKNQVSSFKSYEKRPNQKRRTLEVDELFEK